jgi:glycosyltransferase involved in cell wall biosynthesis
MYTIAIASGLATRPDVELHLLTRTDDAGRWGTLAPRARIHSDAPRSRPHRLVWEQYAAPRLAARVRPDVWHGPHYTMPLRADVPSVITIHDLTFFDHPEWHERPKVPFFRRMIRAVAARADVVICVSEYTAERLRAHLAPNGEVLVIPHGVDHKRFVRQDGQAEVASDTAALARHGVEPPYIAFVGTLEPRKDVPTLVRAFALVAPTQPDLRLVVAGGDGWGTAEVRDAIAASGFATRVIRTGYLDDPTVAALFRRAAAVAYPSQEEGFGLPALEALACGAPLVTTKGSALEEVTVDAALLVPPGDVHALAGALTRLLNDPAASDRLRTAGPERAALFTWERTVDGHIAAYARAMAARAVA